VFKQNELVTTELLSAIKFFSKSSAAKFINPSFIDPIIQICKEGKGGKNEMYAAETLKQMQRVSELGQVIHQKGGESVAAAIKKAEYYNKK
jgi:uncharacterized Fe-S center protein